MTLTITRLNLLKLAVLAMLLATVLILRFLVIPPEEVGELVVQTGYYFVGLNFLLFVFYFGRFLLSKLSRQWLQSHFLGLIICLILTLITQIQEPHQFKVLNDEYALLNNSMAMHYYQKAGLMGQAHIIDGELQHEEFTAGKRGLFFQYLLSLVHGLSGYRPTNAFILNFLVTGFFFTALYLVLNSLVNRPLLVYTGLFAAASIPLLPHIATSGGYDLLNISMILLFVLVGKAYLKSPSPGLQSAFVLSTLLLAQVRYESILYLLALAALVAFTWWRQGELKLSWVSAFSPVFLFIPLMLNAHMFANDALQDAGVRDAGQSFIGMEFLWTNLKDAARFFFIQDSSILNSVTVSVLAAAGFGFLILLLIRERKAIITGSKGALLVFSAVTAIVVLCFLVMEIHFWGILTDPQATRFAIPVYIIGSVCGICLLNEILRGKSLEWMAFGMGMILLGSNAFSLGSKRATLEDWVIPRYNEWIIGYATTNPVESCLYACDGTLGLVANKRAALPIEVVNLLPEEIAELVRSGMYDSVIAFELLYIDETSEIPVPMPTITGLNRQRLACEIVAEKTLNKRFLFRAYKLTGWIDEDESLHAF
jgi:hypothetical protein